MLLIFSIILRNKKLILLTAVAGFAVSSIISLVIPPRYRASASFLPVGVEQEITGNRGFFSQFGGFGEAYATFIRMRRNFVVDFLVRSRTMSELLSQRFDLMEVYDESDPEEVRRILQERTYLEVKEEGVILLDVIDRSPVRAKALVEAYIHNVDSMLISLTVVHAEEKIRFLKSESARRERDIAAVDSVIMDFMREYGVYEIEKQAKAAIEVAAELRARLGMYDVQKKLLEMTLKPGNPHLERIKHEMAGLQEQITVLKEGGGDVPELFPPLDRLPELASRYIHMVSERRAHEFALAYIRLMLEDSRIVAGSEVSVIRIIDPPVVPDKRIWPKRKQIVLVSTGAILLWVCFFLILLDQRRERAAVRGRAGSVSGSVDSGIAGGGEAPADRTPPPGGEG